jgi:hypothetical protein
LTLHDSIWQIFTQRPNVWLTARKVRIILRDEYKLTIHDSEFNQAFLTVRDNCKTEDGVRILHFTMRSKHYYSLTNSRIVRAAHNALLNKKNKANSKRLVHA